MEEQQKKSKGRNKYKRRFPVPVITITSQKLISSAVAMDSLPVNLTLSSKKATVEQAVAWAVVLPNQRVLGWMNPKMGENVEEPTMIRCDTVVLLFLGDRGSWGHLTAKCPNKWGGTFLVPSCSTPPAQSWDYWLHCATAGRHNILVKLMQNASVPAQKHFMLPFCRCQCWVRSAGVFFHLKTLVFCRQGRSHMPCLLPQGRSCVTETSPRSSLPLNFPSFFFLTGAETFSHLQVSVL